jgi:hypothetical protein
MFCFSLVRGQPTLAHSRARSSEPSGYFQKAASSVRVPTAVCNDYAVLFAWIDEASVPQFD